MKNYVVVVLVIILFVAACKKKKDETTAPAANNTNTTPVKGSLYAKVNGVDWNVGKYNNLDATYTSFSAGSYGYGGYSQYDPPYTMLGVSTVYTTGLVSFVKYSPINAYFKDVNGTSYPAISGTMNITQIDTTNMLSKLKATFSFVTDTIMGKSYTVTEGVVNY